MEKCTHEFGLSKKESNNAYTRDEHAIDNGANDINLNTLSSGVTHGTKLHLRSDNIAIVTSPIQTADAQFGLNGNTTIAIPSCNPVDIMPRLINTYKKRTKYAILLMLLATIGFIIGSSICFVVSKHEANKGLNKTKPLAFGIIGVIVSLSLLVFIGGLCDSLRNGFNWMNNISRTIQLDGVPWQSQLDSLQRTVPKNMIGCCDSNVYIRLMNRPNGYIVLTQEGLIVDEVIAFRYNRMIVLRVDLMNNFMQTEWILRVFLVAGRKSKYGENRYKRKIFHVDLFMPPYMQFQEVADIRQNILSNSHGHLVACKFHTNP